MEKETPVLKIETVTCAELSQTLRADVLDHILKTLKLQVGKYTDSNGEKVIFREIKE